MQREGQFAWLVKSQGRDNLGEPPQAPSTKSPSLGEESRGDFCVGQDVAWVWEGSDVTVADHRKSGTEVSRGTGDRLALRLWHLSQSAEADTILSFRVTASLGSVQGLT